LLDWIVGSSLKARRMVIALAAVLVAVSLWRLPDLKQEVIPEFGPPTVEIQTEALGLAPEEVEQLITVPLEQDLLNGLPWLDVIRSRSLPGLSWVQLVFAPGTELLRAREVVQERLTQAHALPNVSQPPQMIQPESSTSRVMMIALTSRDITPIQMSVLARWTIRPRLMGVPGVSNVAVWGMREQQLQVLVDPNRLRDSGVTLSEVIKTTGNALAVSPLSFLEASTPGTGGFIDTPTQRLGVQHVLPITTPEELAKVPLEDDVAAAAPVRLGDVATVVEDHQPLIGDAVLSQGSGLMLVVQKFPGANTVEVAGAVRDAIDEMRPGLKGVAIDPTVYQPATYVEKAAGNLRTAAVVGVLLLLLVLLTLASSWRGAVIGFASVMLSLAAAGLVLFARGASLNAMVVTGLVVALVVIVDDAVGDAANILARVRRRRQEGAPRSLVETIRAASVEMRSGAGYAALIVVATLLPICFMRGLSGDAFLPPLAVTYLLAVALSTVVALTVTPALSLILLSRDPDPTPRESPLIRLLRRSHTRVVAGAKRRPAAVVLAVIAALAATSAAVPRLSARLLPAFKENDLLVHSEAVSGTSLPEMRRITALASDELRALPGVRSVGAHVGRALLSDQTVGVNSSELWVGIDPAADYEKTVASVRRIVAGYPGLDFTVQSYANDQTGTILPGVGAPLAVRVYGNDLSVLREKAGEIRTLLTGIRGVENPQVQSLPEEPTVEIQVDLTKAEQAGIKPGDVRRSATTLLSGLEVGSIFQDQKVFQVVVRGTPGTRSSPADVENLVVDTPSGGHVRLGDIARVGIAPALPVIRHEAVSRSLDVTADVSGRDLDAVMEEVHDRLRSVSFPLEHHAELLGDFRAHRAAQNRMLEFAIAASIGLYLLLQSAFRSWRLASVVFLVLPVALIGGVLGAVADGGEITAGSFVGFLAVLSIAARHSIMLIRRYQELEQEGRAFGPELVAEGTQALFGSIVTTVVAAAALLLPFVLLGSVAGTEVVHPAAVVILGGLVTATFLSLVIVPLLYLKFGSNTATLREPAEHRTIVLPSDVVVLDAGPLMPQQREQS
jgi:Cu/Ag efflux pump CusA